jgi:hypothetical protein
MKPKMAILAVAITLGMYRAAHAVPIDEGTASSSKKTVETYIYSFDTTDPLNPKLLGVGIYGHYVQPDEAAGLAMWHSLTPCMQERVAFHAKGARSLSGDEVKRIFEKAADECRRLQKKDKQGQISL